MFIILFENQVFGCVYNCSGKVSLCHIRRGCNLSCSGFSGGVRSGTCVCGWRYSEEYILGWACKMIRMTEDF